MPKLSLWSNGYKTANYRFIDRCISEYINAGGTACYIHMYMGPYTAQGSVNTPILANDANNPVKNTPPTPASPNITSIQDVLLLENRDRQYSSTVYELRGVYNISDVDHDLRQFGLFLSGDTIFLEFHLNDMIGLLGRKLMSGDVIELPHQRDDALLNDSPAINKFYVVEDANRASSGYSATWWPHIWRVKISPMPASQEYQDILNSQATNPLGFNEGIIGSLISTMSTELGISAQVVENARANFVGRYFETQQYYIVPGTELTGNKPWIYTGDGVPPNGAALAGSGSTFPESPSTGEYYLRTDYKPAALFRYNTNRWVIQEFDWRGTNWSVASRLLEDFINDSSTQTFSDGTTAPTRVGLSKAVKPRADF